MSLQFFQLAVLYHSDLDHLGEEREAAKEMKAFNETLHWSFYKLGQLQSDKSRR